MKKALLVLFVLLMGMAAVFAFDGYIEITNDTGYDIYYIYISPEYSDNWGDDWLGDDILWDGDSVRFDLSGKSSIFDIMCEDEDGDTYTNWGLDVEYYDWEVTLDDID